MAGVSCYNTCPIDRKSRSIRLFRILESSDDRLIRCEMISFELTSCPRYVAVSYTWGINRSTSVISVNSVPLIIQENQRQFLEEQRKKADGEYLWIDALCIDQTNVRERNHQVELMRDIYSKAAIVVVWLGSQTVDSKLAIDYISNFRNRRTRAAARKVWSQAQGKAVLDLCQHHYWRRIWIVQEILLAQDIVIYYGDKTVRWSGLEAVMSYFRGVEGSGRIHEHSPAAAVLGSDAARIVESRNSWPLLHFESKPGALEYLLTTYHDMESTELRDRVYGLLGLVEDVKAKPDGFTISVDYSLPTAQLFSEVYFCLQATPTFDTTAARLALINQLIDRLKVSPRDPLVIAAKAKAEPDVQYQRYKVPSPPLRGSEARRRSNEIAFSKMLQQYNELQEQTAFENMEMQKAQAFWDPTESMSKRDATSVDTPRYVSIPDTPLNSTSMTTPRPPIRRHHSA